MARDGFSIEAGLAKGRPLPDWYLDEPRLLPGEEFYTLAFYRLSSCRSSGMGLGPIPWTVRIEYAERAGLDGDMADAFADILGIMDSAYLSEEHERQQKETKARTAGRPTKPHKRGR